VKFIIFITVQVPSACFIDQIPQPRAFNVLKGRHIIFSEYKYNVTRAGPKYQRAILKPDLTDCYGHEPKKISPTIKIGILRNDSKDIFRRVVYLLVILKKYPLSWITKHGGEDLPEDGNYEVQSAEI
jgi:hypothetical protein